MDDGKTLMLRELKEQYVNEGGTAEDAIDVGPYNKGFWYVNFTKITGGTCTIELMTAARNRRDDYFAISGAAFALTTTTKTWMMVTDFGRYLLLKAQVGSGQSATWEALWVPKLGDTAP